MCREERDGYFGVFVGFSIVRVWINSFVVIGFKVVVESLELESESRVVDVL